MDQVFFPDAPFALKQYDPLHGSRGAESKHEGFEVGEFLITTAQRAGDGLGQTPRLLPGQVLVESRHRGCLRQVPCHRLQAPGGTTYDPWDLGETRSESDDLGVQESGVEIQLKAEGEMLEYSHPLVLAPTGPDAGHGATVYRLQVPGLVSVKPEMAADGVKG